MERVACALCGVDAHQVVYAHPSGGVANGVCRRCGLAYLSPRPDAAARARLYRDYQQAYPEAFLLQSDNPFAVVARERAGFARAWLESGARVTEVGCSYGHFAAALGALGARVRGIDLSQPQLAFARERLGVEAAAGAVEDLPADASADLVAMFHVIEHLPDPLGALARIRQHLRPGGILLLDLPHAQQLPHDAIEHLYVASGQHLFAFTPAVLEAALAAAGFETLSLAHHPLPAVYRANLRAVARRGPEPAPAAPDPARAGESLNALRRYHAGLARLGSRVRRRVDDWLGQGRRIALFGAGFHTRGLIDLCQLGPDQIHLVIDDDPAKQGDWLAGMPIRGSEALREEAIGGVLVSTLASEQRVARRLARERIPGLCIATLYSEEETGTGFGDPARPEARP